MRSNKAVRNTKKKNGCEALHSHKVIHKYLFNATTRTFNLLGLVSYFVQNPTQKMINMCQMKTHFHVNKSKVEQKKQLGSRQ